MVLKVYSNPISQPGRALLIFLKANNIPHEYHFVDLEHGENKTPEYLEINPTGFVPAIVDGEFHLAESHAILAYLHGTRHTPDHWYPHDLQKRAVVDMYLHWHHSRLRKAADVVYGRVWSQLMHETVPEAVVQDAIEIRNKAFVRLESWLTQHHYVAGNEVSIGDLTALCEVSTTQVILNFDFAQYPHIQAWVARMFTIPAVVEWHEPLNQLKAKLDEAAAAQV